MLRLGARLSVGGGRAAVVSAVLIAVTVALGTAFVLVGMSISPALQARADRAAWTQELLPDQEVGAPATVTVASSVSYLGSDQIRVVAVAGADGAAPVPPGLEQLPGPGEAYVSPAVAALMLGKPETDGRYGDVVGLIARGGLRGPDDLVVVRGVSLEQAGLDGVTVTSFSGHGTPYRASGVERLVLGLGAVALIAPIALLISISVRLNATTRQRRRSALQLVGATVRQLRVITLGEVLAPVLIGALLGPVLFAGLRTLLAHISYEGTAFYVDDLWPGTAVAVAVVLTVIAVCLTSATVAGSGTEQGGVGDRRPAVRTRSRVRVSSALALIGVAAVLVSTDAADGSATTRTVGAFACLLTGLVLLGPTIVATAGRTVERLPGAAALLAGRHLRDHPRQALWPAAGVGLAVLATVLFAALTPAAARSLDRTDEVGQRQGTARAEIPYTTTSEADDLVARLDLLDGVAGATTVMTAQLNTASGPQRAWIGDCTAIAAATQIAGLSCAASGLVTGSDVAANLSEGDVLELYDLDAARPTAWDAVPDGTEPDTAHVAVARDVVTMPSQRGADMPDLIIDPSLLDIDPALLRPTLIVFTYGTASVLESARTLVESGAHGATIATRDTTFEGFSQDVRRLYRAITVGAVAVGIVCACTLILSAAAGLIERRRTYTLLRTTGARLRTLQFSVVLEGAVPVLVVGILCAAAGIAMGWALTPDGGYPLAGVAIPVAGILSVATATVCLNALLADRLTRTEDTRTE